MVERRVQGRERVLTELLRLVPLDDDDERLIFYYVAHFHLGKAFRTLQKSIADDPTDADSVRAGQLEIESFIIWAGSNRPEDAREIAKTVADLAYTLVKKCTRSSALVRPPPLEERLSDPLFGWLFYRPNRRKGR